MSYTDQSPNSILGVKLSPIIITRGTKLLPYLTTTDAEEHHIDKQSFGRIFGFFQATPGNESHAYIGNTLSAQAKRDYFNLPKRLSVSERFERVIERLNQTLGNCVSHGEVSWQEGFQAGLVVVAENRIYFSLAGEASLTMFRDGQSQVFTSPHKGAGIQHPYHTFDSLISGELRPGDGLLLAGGELHYFLPPHTLERERNRLSEERFIQMLTTALHNETSLSCVYVGTVTTKAVVAPVLFEPAKEVLVGMPNVNAFSATTFKPKGAKRRSLFGRKPAEETAPEGITESTPEKQQNEGHYYVRGDEDTSSESTGPFSGLKRFWSMHGSHAFESLWSDTNRQIRRMRQSKPTGNSDTTLTLPQHQYTEIIPDTTETPSTPIPPALPPVAEPLPTVDAFELTDYDTPENWSSEEVAPKVPKPSILTAVTPLVAKVGTGVSSSIGAATSSIAGLVSLGRAKWNERKTKDKPEELYAPIARKSSRTSTAKRTLETPRVEPVAVVPSSSIRRKVGKAVSSSHSWADLRSRMGRTTDSELMEEVKDIFRPNQKVAHTKRKGLLLRIALGATILLAVGLGIARYMTPEPVPTAPKATITDTTKATPTQPKAAEGNTNALVNGQIPSGKAAFAPTHLVTLNSKSFILGDKSIQELPAGELVALPGTPKLVTAMDDLRTLFIYTTDAKLYAYTPSNKKFTENTLPENTTVTSLYSFLTYLYTFDAKTSNLTRLSRTTGGFTGGTNWFKSPVPAGTKDGIVVGESVYLSGGNGLEFWEKGKKVGVLKNSTGFIPRHVSGTQVVAASADKTQVRIWKSNTDVAPLTLTLPKNTTLITSNQTALTTVDAAGNIYTIALKP